MEQNQYLCSVTSTSKKYSLNLQKGFKPEALGKGCWIGVINAERIPPHIGMIFNGRYCSLNIKGKEIDVETSVLLRKIEILRIPALFIKLIPHPVFSVDFLHEHFKLELEKHEKVTLETTCFAPVRAFMQENYLLKQEELGFLFELFPILYREQMIEKVFGLHVSDDNANTFSFVPYTQKSIEDKLNDIQHVKQ